MSLGGPRPLVHLELHTADAAAASDYYRALCNWQSERVVTTAGSYLALDLGGAGGGLVECSTPRALWLPYVEVEDIIVATEQARRLGARVLLAPREGPAGWRSVVAAPAAGELALWQPKR